MSESLESWRPPQSELGDPQVEANPYFKAAIERANSLVERGKLSEVLRIIEELEKEVAEMELAQRFSCTRKIKENENRGVKLIDNYEEMTEAEFKKAELQNFLIKMRQEVLSVITKLKDIVLNIEAAKKD